MKDKKGFTLIELLAVLVVLSVILSISVPKIMDVRYESSKKAFTNDVDELQGIAQLEYNNKKEARVYNFEDGNQTNVVNEEDKLNFKGDNPGDGYIKIYSNGDIEYELTSRDHVFCASKEVGDRKGKIEKCKDPTIEKFTLNLSAITTTNSIRVTVTPKNGEQDVLINEYYYQLDDGKVISSNKASYLYENLKAEENGKLKDYVIKVKACTKKGKCVEEKITVNLKQIDGIKYNLSTTEWSLEKTITFTYPEIKNIDGQSIGKNEISTDGGRTFKIYRGSITVNKDTTFVARITDGTNTKSSISVLVNKFDHTAPTITNVTGNPSNWTKNNVTLTVNGAKDKGDNNVEPGSGLANAAYSFDGGATWQASASKTYTSNTSGIVIKVRDRLGNIYTHSGISITKIDKTGPSKPTITLYQDNNNLVATNGYTSGSWTSKSVLTDARSSDSQSGIAYYQYSNDNKNWSNDISKLGWTYSYNNGKNILRYWITWSGQWNFYVRAVDNAGNVGSISNMFTLRIDKNAPTAPTITGQINSWINHYQIIWTTNKSTAASGINRYQICDISVNNVNQCSWRDLYNNTSGTSSGLDVAYYHANYGDLINAFKGNTGSLNQHYINYGRNEGRKASNSNWVRTAQNISANGVHYIFFRAISNVGIVGKPSNVQALYIDTSTPTTPTIIGQINGWINHYQVVWVTNYSSSISGINRYQICDISVNNVNQCSWRDLYNNTAGTSSGLDVAYYHANNGDLINAFLGNTGSLNQHYLSNGRNEGRKASDSNWVRTAQNISAEGTHFIFFRAVNNAGSVSAASNVQSLYIDVTKPNAYLNPSGGTYLQNSEISGSCTDSVSGVKSVTLTDHNYTTSGTNYTSQKFASLGTHNNSKVVCQDNAGNTQEVSASYTIVAASSGSGGSSSRYCKEWTDARRCTLTLKGLCVQGTTSGGNCRCSYRC